jgi:hypothetical protein
MIRLIQCVRRKPGITVDAFRRHWQAYQQAYEALAAATGARRFAVSFGLKIPFNTAIQELRGTLEPFDAVLEVWWDNGAQLDGVEEAPEIAARIAETRRMQEAFMDLEASSIFFASVESDQALT